MSTQQFDVIVVGGGQAGLATGYHLRRRGVSFVILEAQNRIGESWRRRWETLSLFTRARISGLPGMRFPAPAQSFPTKDEVAGFMEEYARRMDLPVRTGVHVDSLDRTDDGRFVLCAGDDRFETARVIVATGGYGEPRIPDFASDLDPAIRQLHSSEYRNASSLLPGAVLVVGASNSGGEIAHSAASAGHETWLSGRDTGQMPFDINGRVSRLVDLAFWPFIHHVVTMRTPIGRRARPFIQEHGGPLERIRKAELEAAGVRRVIGRTVGASDGMPRLDDGQVLDVGNVVWATGFRHDYPWIRLPVMGEDGWPVHERGVASSMPGLAFVGLPFQYAATSALIGGVGRDAKYVVDRLLAEARSVR